MISASNKPGPPHHLFGVGFTIFIQVTMSKVTGFMKMNLAAHVESQESVLGGNRRTLQNWKKNYPIQSLKVS